MVENNVSLAALYEENLKSIQEGQILKGKVVKVGIKDVLVDIGYKCEGVVRIEEFFSPEELVLGKEIEVYIESTDDEKGMIPLSREKARKLYGWDKINVVSKEGDLIDGVVRRKTKGGYIVDVYGIEGFLPASLSAFKNVSDNEVLNRTFKFKIIKMNNLKRSLIVSRKDAVSQEREENKEKIWGTLKIGEVYKGKVKNITDFGAFIDLGGVDGLLHITDMSWARISHPSEIVAVGDEVEVMVLTINKDSKKVSLGLKQRMTDPWQGIEEKFPINSRIQGKIVNILPYGVFVELDKGIEGLIHVSEITWQKRNINPQEMFSIGENAEVQVLNIDKEQRRISLSIKQLELNPWLEAEQKYSIGAKVEGKVSGFSDFGVFVELDSNLEGMVHVSDISWVKRITNLGDIFKKGQKIEAVVLSVDSQNRKISLGLKQLEENPWQEIAKKYPIDAVIEEVEVIGISNYGVFVRIDGDLEGLIYSNEIEKSEMEKLKPLDKIRVKVIKVDVDQAKIGLSAKI